MDKNKLLARRLPTAPVEIPGVGTVTVRGLSRAELLNLRSAENTAGTERLILHYGLVDPELTEEEAGQWQASAPAGELDPVTTRIRDLSGLGEGADKAQYKSVPGGPVA